MSGAGGGFPGGLVIRNPLANAGDTGLIPDPICHGAAKPMCHNYGVRALEPRNHSKRSHHSESPEHHSWRAPPLSAPREKPTQQGRPAQPKIIIFLKKTVGEKSE